MALPEVVADALAGVRIFAGLDAADLAEVADGSTRVPVRAGELLFDEGDHGDALFVVLTGRLEAFAGTPPRVLRVLARGDAIGELALLTDSPRSASVRARRDSELLRVDAAVVARLLADEPAFAAAVTRSLAERLRASQALDARPSPVPATVAVVALPGAGAAAELAAALAGLTGGEHITRAEAGDPDDYAALLDRAERSHGQVVLAADPGDGEWRDFCLRQADRTLALAAGRPAAEVPQLPVEGPVDVLLAGPAAPGALGAWIDALGAGGGRLLGPPDGWGRSLPPLARALTGRSTALVCSGGGARAFAHIGVIEVLTDAGVVIDRLAGVSMGAVVAASAAMGVEPAAIRECCVSEFVQGRPMGDYTLPLVAMVRGRNAEAMLARMYGDALIEELPTQFTCASCDLVASELLLHRRGPLAEAVCASFCLPGVGPPVAMGERLLVDGGVMDNLPVEAVSGAGEGPVIASDVTARFELPTRRARRGPVARRLRDAVLGRGGDSPLRLPEVLVRSITVGSIDTTKAGDEHADAVIRPDVSRVGMLAFGEIDRMIEAGRRAARAVVEARPELVG